MAHQHFLLGGILSTAKIFSTPKPVFPTHNDIFSLQPNKSTMSSLTSSGFALVNLLYSKQGWFPSHFLKLSIDLRLFEPVYFVLHLQSKCPFASGNRSKLHTKTTWPGVSIKFRMYSSFVSIFHLDAWLLSWYHVLVPDPCCQAIVLFFTSRNGLCGCK
jgi:hypothetical protein